MDKTLGGAGALPTSAEEPETTVREPTSYDSTPELDAAVAGFDLEAWVNGITPVRHSVRLYGNLDQSKFNTLSSDEQDARLSGATSAQLKKIIDARKKAAQEITDSALDVVFEGRTADAVNRALAKGRELGYDGNDLSAYTIAQQIVEPAGFDFEIVKALADNPMAAQQWSNLITTWKKVNEESGVTIPF